MSIQLRSSYLLVFFSFLLLATQASAQKSDLSSDAVRQAKHQDLQWLTVQPHLPDPATASPEKLEQAEGDFYYMFNRLDVAMTHYCAAQNQPRLKTSHIDVASGNLDFEFVDATNLGSPDAPHVYGVEMRLLNADHITLAFLFEGNGKRSKEFIDLKRVGHKPTSQ